MLKMVAIEELHIVAVSHTNISGCSGLNSLSISFLVVHFNVEVVVQQSPDKIINACRVMMGPSIGPFKKKCFLK
jgi:hypothetical protein